jgi:hypothetical protein
MVSADLLEKASEALPSRETVYSIGVTTLNVLRAEN